MKLSQRVAVRFILLSLVLLLAGWVAWFFLRPPAIDLGKVYRIGYGNDTPLHFAGKDGRPTGLAVEIVQEAARRTGIKLEWVEGNGFDQANMDMWVLMTVLPERLKLMHFSEPYLQAQSCFLVRADSPIHEVTELTNARISCRDVPIVRAVLKELLPDARLVDAHDTDGAIELLTQNQADAVLSDQHVLMMALLHGESHSPLRMLPYRSPRRPLAIAATFANAAVADELRRGMQAMMEDRSSTRLIERWTFFFDPATAVIGEAARERNRVHQLVIGLVSLSIVSAIMVGLIVWSRRQSARLRQTKKLLHDVADRVPGVVYQFQLNADGTACFPYASEAIRQIYRISPESVLTDAAPVFAVLHPEDRAGVDASIRQSAQNLTPWRHEYRVKFDDGTVRWLAGSALPQRELEGVTLWHGFISDITERKAAEAAMQTFERNIQQTQKLESLGLLAGGIAHDFNNILTGILGNTHLASLSLAAGQPEHEQLNAIKQGCLRAAELCKQMLDYSGKGRFVTRKFSLNSLVEETTQLLRLSISKQVELRFNLAPDLPPIEADPTQIRQVVMNLVINASEAIGTQNGLITLTTTLRRLQPDAADSRLLAPELPAGAYVCLEISDTGCGMSAETQARIFDPFFTTKFAGRGLGLAAVHGIVRAHKGAMKVYSEPGRGTTFKLFFPSVDGTAELIASPDPVNKAAGWRGQGCLLVVDDEENVRQALSAMLPKIGFTVVTARDGREGVERFRANPGQFTAVLMDLTMPQLDGRQAFAELRRIRPEVRVVLMSGFNQEELAPELAGFLQKPFDFEALVAVLHDATGGSPVEK